MNLFKGALFGFILAIAVPAAAQNASPAQRGENSQGSTDQGRRETVLDARPLDRIQSRIASRIQNRITSRGEYISPLKQGNRASKSPEQ